MTWWLFIASSSEHSFQLAAVKHGAKFDSRADWMYVSPSSETRLEHIHLMMDAADADSINEAAGGPASDGVSCIVLSLLFLVVSTSLRHYSCYYQHCHHHVFICVLLDKTAVVLESVNLFQQVTLRRSSQH